MIHCCVSAGYSQNTLFIDIKGVMRWKETREDVRLFGVNYTLPFAHSFRMHDRLGVDHKQAIEDDVYHMARLGFDAFRVHVFDCEVSDTLGNLMENEHLDLLDYLIFELKKRKIKCLLTPIAYWGNGYPEPNEKTPGFLTKYGKANCLVDVDAIKAQENYLFQFMNHLNPYTGKTYKDDPDIIGFEINNEPHNPEGINATRNVVNTLAKAIRKSGCKKPLFYNMSIGSPHFAEAFLSAEIQGGTFHWYPTRLVHGRELGGNYLPHVDKYNLPFSNEMEKKGMAKLIYEFDTPDIGRSYMYPAMARSFREAGFQWVTQFAYDPMHMAFANTEYQTHFLNLAYTPRKAISMKIASEVFHKIPLKKSFGRYPENIKFENALVDFEKDLSVYNSEEKFFYSNHNSIQPVKPEKLNQIAGYGNSTIIQYEGSGAYFLDKIQEGIWRLEIMPDALWVRDPFEKASLKKKVAVVKWNQWSMKINLPDLGDSFDILPLNQGNNYSTEAKWGELMIKPGTYLLQRKNINFQVQPNLKIQNLHLDEFVAPQGNADKVYLVHNAHKEIIVGKDLTLLAKVVGPSKIDRVELVIPTGWNKTEKYEMQLGSAYTYSVCIPGNRITGDSFNYYMLVTTQNRNTTFPSEVQGSPEDWDFVSKDIYASSIVFEESPILLFDASSQHNNIVWPDQWGGNKFEVKLLPGKFSSDKLLSVSADGIDQKPHDLTFKVFIGDIVKERHSSLRKMDKIVIRAASGEKETQIWQLALLLKNGSAFGKTIETNRDLEDFEIHFDALLKVPHVLLPRPYPEFQYYWFESPDSKFSAEDVDAIQISVGPGIPEKDYSQKQHIIIDKIWFN
ncbi:MAG: hypothetical protein AMS23_07200 [Bacteroides sp. SM1_62]|nr:MAG: hypothetical protein AMS26_08695 [Bacteroides sp. SM23_62]KPL22968.1 MAG: hypothetical protein AMS23_07200 [Bacteroides sp. SM1_62]